MFPGNAARKVSELNYSPSLTADVREVSESLCPSPLHPSRIPAALSWYLWLAYLVAWPHLYFGDIWAPVHHTCCRQGLLNLLSYYQNRAREFKEAPRRIHSFCPQFDSCADQSSPASFWWIGLITPLKMMVLFLECWSLFIKPEMPKWEV